MRLTTNILDGMLKRFVNNPLDVKDIEARIRERIGEDIAFDIKKDILKLESVMIKLQSKKAGG